MPATVTTPSRRQPTTHPGHTSQERNWRMLFLLPAAFTAAWVVSNLLVVALLLPAKHFVPHAVLQTAAEALAYLFTIAMVIAAPILVRRQSTTNRSILGLGRRISWTDIGLAPVTYVLALLTQIIVFVVVAAVFPGLPLHQAQQLGFHPSSSLTATILAFLTIVVIAPLAEETLFRGYLYGHLKTHVPAVLAGSVTSLLFGIAHFNWRVSIAAFVMSLFLCGLRSRTGSIWAGVLVHMITNGVAFYIVFVPLIGA
jgi:uncharacterized protein